MIFAHYCNVDNTGDKLCCPKLYFPAWSEYPSNFLYYDNAGIAISSGPIVIGGGGVMVPESQGFYDFLFTLKRPCVVWGAGTNGRADDPFWMPSQIDQFKLVGIRDFGVGLPYVPCPSCLHPAFDMTAGPVHDFIVFEAVTKPIEIDAPVRLNTNHPWFLDIAKSILSARTVVTNSYHGAYWSMLLNRRVILLEVDSNRFNYLKHKPPRCNYLNWTDFLKGDPIAPSDFKDESRSLNLDFASKVRSIEKDAQDATT